MWELRMYHALTTTLGWGWPYTRSTYLWVLLALWLCFGGAIVWLIVTMIAVRRRVEAITVAGRPAPTESSAPRMTLSQYLPKITRASKHLGLVLLTGAVYALGWGTRDWQLTRNVTTMDNLRVLEDQQGDMVRLVQEDLRSHLPEGDAFTIKFCSGPHPIGLRRGNLLKLGWQEEGECQRVFDGQSQRLGWLVDRDRQQRPTVYISTYMRGGE